MITIRERNLFSRWGFRHRLTREYGARSERKVITNCGLAKSVSRRARGTHCSDRREEPASTNLGDQVILPGEHAVLVPNYGAQHVKASASNVAERLLAVWLPRICSLSKYLCETNFKCCRFTGRFPMCSQTPSRYSSCPVKTAKRAVVPGPRIRGLDIGIRTPGTGFGAYNGLANSPFHRLVFGTKDLCSGELPYVCAKRPCSEPVVQLLCNPM